MNFHQPLSLLVFFVVMTSGGADTQKPEVKNFDDEYHKRPEGEAFYFEPYALYEDKPIENITWHKNGSGEISNNRDELVHYQGGKLFFLKLKTEDSGHYTARHEFSAEKLFIYHLYLRVLPKNDKGLLVLPITAGYQKVKIPCPDIVKETCGAFSGTYSWEKDSNPLQDNRSNELWLVSNKANEGIYTCICTWTLNQKEYITSGSRRMKVEGLVVHKPPRILAPTSKEQFADQGSGITLNCSVLCGINAGSDCTAYWLIDGKPVNQTGYVHTTKM